MERGGACDHLSVMAALPALPLLRAALAVTLPGGGDNVWRRRRRARVGGGAVPDRR